MSADEWRKRLASLPVEIRYFETIGSTNDEAVSWAANHAAEYSLVVAEHQSAGRGRLKRTWVTRTGAGLAFSLILHPDRAEAGRITLFSSLAAMALCATLSRYAFVKGTLGCQIKWPNDVLINGKKAAGILVECSWLGEQPQSVVIGMGVNVKPQAVPRDIDLLFPATSLEEEIAEPLNRIDLLHDIIEQIINLRAVMLKDQFIERYNQLLAYKGQKVEVQHADQAAIAGSLVGVRPDGDLELRTEQGKSITVSVGDVHLRPA